MDTTLRPNTEQKHKRRGATISVIVHILLILLALLPLLTFPDPPPGQEGILVNLGLPDVGEGDENAAPAEAVEADEPEPEEAQPETQTEEVEEDQPEEEPAKSEPEPVETKEVVTSEDPDEIALKKEKERKKKEADAKREAERKAEEAKAKAEAERKAKEAKAKAEAERKAKEASDLKNELSGLFGDGDGKGNTGTAGNQGDPDGDPSSDKLEGISTGSGQVGGGLSNRGVVKIPKPRDSSQKAGKVVMKVCINQSGKVISAEFTQRGSTIADQGLIKKARASAMGSKFEPGDEEKLCGTITYTFKVQ
jgi:outer membrane biosynthesis protein TonB